MRLIGLEPTRPKSPDPKSGASTNFATSAREMGVKAQMDFKEHFRAEAKTRSNFATSAREMGLKASFRLRRYGFFTDKCEKKVTFL